MSGSRKISERTLYVLSLVVAALFFGNIYYQLHIAPNWAWGPALDKMPKELMHNFRAEVYENGKGGYAADEYLAKDKEGKLAVEFDPTLFPEFVDGSNAKSELIQPLIGDGRTVTVAHKLTINGVTKNVVDIYHVGPRGGRIDNIKRFIAEE